MSLSAVLAQFPVGFSVQRNLESIDSVLQQTRAGDLVLFPEGCVSGYSTDTTFLQHVPVGEVMAGLHAIQEEAVRRKISVWAGACVYHQGQWFNAAYGFSPNGKTQIYYKINLANHERGVFTAGDRLPVFEWMTSDGIVPIGVQICRELRYPEQWGWLARCGAQMILHLNNAIGDESFQPVWKSHLISRAAETQRFILSTNNAAAQQISPTLAVEPSGRVLGEIVSAELRTLRVDLDLSKSSHLYLDQCRTDVVEIKAT
jgi:predicted amidohydrolase